MLVALDGSPTSFRAGREAARLFADAEFLMVKVTEVGMPWLAGSELGPFGMVYPATAAELARERPDVTELSALARSAGLDDAALLNPTGDPASAICAAAEAHDVDVVVVGGHDRGLLRRLIDPSVAQAVVHGTFRPVLVVSGTPPSPTD